MEYRHRKQIEESIRAEDKRDQAVPLSKDRITTNITRCSFINLIIKSGPAAMDLLLSGKPVLNKISYRLAVRILTMAPQDDEDFQNLKKNLILFATLSADDTLSPSKLLNMYCQRLIWQLHQLRLVSKLDSTKLKLILGDLVKDHGWKYFLGNSKLKNQLEFWVAKDQEREELMAIPDEINTMGSWVKSRAQAEQEQEEATSIPDPPPAPLPVEVEAIPAAPLPAPLQAPLPATAGPSTQAPQGAQQSKTPIKQFEGSRANWSDHTRVQLLRLYIKKALNPFERPPAAAPRSKAVYKRNAPEGGDLYQNSYIYLENRDKVALNDFTSYENMLVQLGQRKLSGQTFGLGLVSIIDKFFEDQDLPMEKEYLELEEDNIIEFAKKFMENPSSK